MAHAQPRASQSQIYRSHRRSSTLPRAPACRLPPAPPHYACVCSSAMDAAGSVPSTAPDATAARSTVHALYQTAGGVVARVRPYATKADFSALVELQTTSFHERPAISLLNQLSYQSFRAEVLDGVRKKEKYSDPASFQILMAEDVSRALPPQSTLSTPPVSLPEDAGRLVSLPMPNDWMPGMVLGPVLGAVEVTIMDESEVLLHLPGLDNYCYISSMAVAHEQRRKGVANTLMQAVEEQARSWGQPQLALHVYEDNTPAVQLYQRSGYSVIYKDPSWNKIMGKRVRLLMAKRV